MAMSINTNLVSMQAQNAMVKSQNMSATAQQRLTNGVRINSAKDDAAGLGISDRMNAEIKGLNQAMRNANDSVSLAQTAEGSLSATTTTLQRMRELAVQSSNSTYSTSDREAIQLEMDQLVSEIDRTASASTFNGIKLLDGSFKNKAFQVGAQAGETIKLSVSGATAADLSLSGFKSSLGDVNSGRIKETAPTADFSISINGQRVDIDSTTKWAADTIAKTINDTEGTNVTASAYNVVSANSIGTGVGVTGLKITTSKADGTAGTEITISDSDTMDQLVSNINREVSGITASLDSSGKLQLASDTGATITVGGSVTNTGLTADTYTGYLSLTGKNNGPVVFDNSSDAAVENLQNLGFNGLDATGKAIGTGFATTTGALAAGDFSINGVSVGASDAGTAASKAVAINKLTNDTGVVATAQTRFEIDAISAKALADDAGAAVFKVTIGSTEYEVAGGFAGSKLSDVVTGIEGAEDSKGTTLSDLGFRAEIEGDKVVIYSDQALEFKITDATGKLATTTGQTLSIKLQEAQGSISLKSNDSSPIVLQDNTGATGLTKVGMVAQGGNDAAGNVGKGVDVLSVDKANLAIEKIDNALKMVASNRATLGAFQNRIDITSASLMTRSENISAARGRIHDADFAAEATNNTRASILQQTGIAMIAQANQSAQQALSLLR